MEEILIVSDSDDESAIEVLHVNIPKVQPKKNTAAKTGGRKVEGRKRKRCERKVESQEKQEIEVEEEEEEEEEEMETTIKKSKEEVQRDYNYPIRYDAICKLEKYPMYAKRDEPNYELRAVETQNDPTKKLRELQLLFVEDALRALMGNEAFCAAYPGRPSASQQEGPITASRRETKRAKVKNIQARWNRENGAWNMPFVLLEDWTAATPDYDRLDQIEVRPMSMAAGIGNLGGMSGGRWNLENGAWNMPFVFLEDWTAETPDYDRLDQIEFSQECSFKDAGVEKEFTRLRWHKYLRDLTVERGRQRELLIFRDNEKGWSLRALTEYESGDLITCFVGEIGLDVPSNDIAVYDIGLSCKAKKRQVHINAGRRANESRFFAHHCRPNVQSEETVICRRGKLIRAVAFWAVSPIKRGDELNIDYFPNQTLETTDTSTYFEYCFCGHSACRFSESKVRAYREKQAQKRKRAVRVKAQRPANTGIMIEEGDMTSRQGRVHHNRRQ